MSIPVEAQTVVQAAMRDAASRTNVAPGQVTLVTLEQREWRDASLGCPQPGTLYAQVITPGWFVVVRAGGREMQYHTDLRSRAVFCKEA